MKKNSITLVIVFLFAFVFKMSYSTSKNTIKFLSYRVEANSLIYTVPLETDIELPVEAPQPFSIFLDKCYVGFKEALAFKESQGNYTVVNPYGYMGKYQFGRGTLEMIGIKDTSSFLKNSKLQEAAFSANTARNKWILRKDIKRSVGKRINGIVVTESGILAAAHLAGAGNVKKYLRSYGAFVFNDANGTTIAYYLKKFSGYDTSFVIPNRKAKAQLM